MHYEWEVSISILPPLPSWSERFPLGFPHRAAPHPLAPSAVCIIKYRQLVFLAPKRDFTIDPVPAVLILLKIKIGILQL